MLEVLQYYLTHPCYHLPCPFATPPHTLTQVRWVAFRKCWLTAADDDMFRMFDPDGVKLWQIPYVGGSVQYLFVDNVNKLLVAAMLDKNAYVFGLEDDPLPKAR